MSERDHILALVIMILRWQATDNTGSIGHAEELQTTWSSKLRMSCQKGHVSERT